jgi:N-acetyl-beta-hexosaminidase
LTFSFSDIPQTLLDGAKELSTILDIKIDADGIPVYSRQSAGKLLVKYRDGAAQIRYSRKAEFFRGLSLLAERIGGGEFEIEEERAYDSLGAMYDNSRNGVFKPETVKKLVRHLALMGFDSLMLYTEDTYEVEQYPYFGHMRGRFTKTEIQECDSYAAMFGVELIPCIQTLAHLNAAFKWEQFKEIRDCDDILLVEDEKTYELIDAMLRALSEMYTSRNINIGMDEAHMVGLGKYLDKHGYQKRFDVMIKHLTRVIELCGKYGFKPSMWSDMFFRLLFSSYYDTAEIDQKLMDMIPKEVALAYWDYYSQEKRIYDRNIENHLKFKNEVIFAGGAWKWMGFIPNNRFSFKTSRMALESCREHGIRHVIATGWSDNGAECSSFATLPVLQLFAEDCYTQDTTDAHIEKRLATCAKANFKDFMDLDNPNFIKGNEAPGGSSINPSKYLLYQDVLCGLFDRHTEIGANNKFYRETAQNAQKAAQRNPSWAYIFETNAVLCSVLEFKCDIGLRIRQAYHSRDIIQLQKISSDELPKLLFRVEHMHELLRAQWNRENKIFGFDVQDIRFGGLKERIKTAKRRIDGFLAAEYPVIEELEVAPLDYWCRTDQDANPNIMENVWLDIVTPNIL